MLRSDADRMAPIESESFFDINNRAAFWMPFTPNRQFKQSPRLLSGAAGMYYTTPGGRKIIDGSAGLWCVNAGHCREKIVAAVQRQVAELDFAPSFQFGHPGSFKLAAELAMLAPGDLDHVFFTNSGSEAVDTALKIALAYHRVRGDAGRYRLIGRERGYHGTGFGGIAVGGMVANRRSFGPTLSGVDHLRHTHDPQRQAFTRGQPEQGAELADDLERLVALHDASTIAAVIVEPVAGSTGVLPPPLGYLRRLREICDKYGILLIFDEVITGYGRLGEPFAGQYFDVVPDMMTTAKGLTSGVVPMGAVFARSAIYEAFMEGPEHMIELFHGYTYSAHPLACAAALATLETYAEENLLTRVAEEGLDDYFADSLHGLKGLPHVTDIRNIGLMGAIDLEPIAGQPGKRGFDFMREAFDRGLLLRISGDTLALSPPLIVSCDEIDMIMEIVADLLKQTS